MKKILVVDDDGNIRQMLEKRLAANGYSVLLAENGLEAIHKAQISKPDLIILDIMMPGIDGTETAHRLKDNPKTEDIPIIYLTALKEQRDDYDEGMLGPNVIFAKPFNSDELLAKIRELT